VNSYKSFLPWQQKVSSTIEKEYSSDSRLGEVYLEDSDLQLVAEIAIVAGRPLLLRGESGSGKSSFAPFIARNLNWKYYEFNVTGRTEAKELLWRFDALRRLRDAQAAKNVLETNSYITPGVLWWAFDNEDATNFVKNNQSENLSKKIDSEPFVDLNLNRTSMGAVVLIDEIDKADPNVPNDLLEVIGMNSFTIDETGKTVKRQNIPLKSTPVEPTDYGNLLIVITTNEERDLPPAFVRRCVIYNLDEPTDKELLTQRWFEIAKLHLGQTIKNHSQGEDLVRKLADKCWDLREKSRSEIRRSPCIAEFLDALKTCLRLNINTDSERWKQIEQSVLLKKK
jgi:MoxR-like ATPase